MNYLIRDLFTCKNCNGINIDITGEDENNKLCLKCKVCLTYEKVELVGNEQQFVRRKIFNGGSLIGTAKDGYMNKI